MLNLPSAEREARLARASRLEFNRTLLGVLVVIALAALASPTLSTWLPWTADLMLLPCAA